MKFIKSIMLFIIIITLNIILVFNRIHKRISNKYSKIGPNTTGKKLSLVLDLDETLIHTPNVDENHFFSRPHLQRFLLSVSKYYEIIIFTAGNKEYADPILNIIDPYKLISHRLYYDDLTKDYDGTKIKNLYNLKRPVNQIIIVDDKQKNYKNLPYNGINIKPFTIIKDKEDIRYKKEGQYDLELLQLKYVLIAIAKEKPSDVTDYIKKYYNNELLYYVNKYTYEIIEESKTFKYFMEIPYEIKDFP